MTRPVKFAHVVYQTRRYEEMIAWYREVFEAEIVNQDPALCFMTYDDEHHRFAFANLDLLKPEGAATDARGQIGVNHVAYTYANVADLLATCRPGTRLCVAADLTAPSEWIRTDTVEAWRASRAEIGKRPAIFLLLA